jgi:hypothetical protein
MYCAVRNLGLGLRSIQSRIYEGVGGREKNEILRWRRRARQFAVLAERRPAYGQSCLAKTRRYQGTFEQPVSLDRAKTTRP